MTSVAPTETEIDIMPAVTAARIKANKPKMVTMTLLRNYMPGSDYEVLGYNKEPVQRKNPAGKMVVIEPGGFIAETDEQTGKIMPMPSPTPGTGTPGKLWAGTVLRIGTDEAKAMRKAGIAEAEIED